MKLAFSEVFNLLLDHVPNADGSTYTLVELSERVQISRPQLTQYKSGKRNNPTLESIRAILEVFEMPIALLDCETKDEALQLIQAVRAAQMEQPFHFRNPDARGLSDEALHQVETLFGWILKREKAIRSGGEIPPPPDFSTEDPADGS